MSLVASLVAMELYKIFCVQGPPMILQSDNGSEFCNELLRILSSSFGMKMVHGRARHPQSQGSVERANADIGRMIMAWMQEHNSKYWSVGIHEVQYQKNCRYHKGHLKTPYELVYGQPPRPGLLSLDMDPKLIQRLQTVQDLAESGLVGGIDPDEWLPDDRDSESRQVDKTTIVNDGHNIDKDVQSLDFLVDSKEDILRPLHDDDLEDDRKVEDFINNKDDTQLEDFITQADATDNFDNTAVMAPNSVVQSSASKPSLRKSSSSSSTSTQAAVLQSSTSKPPLRKSSSSSSSSTQAAVVQFSASKPSLRKSSSSSSTSTPAAVVQSSTSKPPLEKSSSSSSSDISFLYSNKPDFRDAIAVRSDDWDRLKPGIYFNDNCIDVYTRHLQASFSRAKKIHIFRFSIT